MKKAEPKSESGMVTVELAMAMVGIVLVLGMVLCAVAAVRTQASLCQAAREGARSLSIGADADAAARNAFGGDLSVFASKSEQWARVRVESAALELGGLHIGSLQCKAVTLAEVSQ
ncbi:pilus assembly protein TadE [Actinomycetaceae bacterium WB03_NA08]|uniref:Pilus assembly protein TadE n=1 Tax=Scrofimicrobium canadense TaxID=2652290 RepID=A0A6N7VQR8_9ACTO|nr:pilus assembly protein TadE [Scrofimicrobium canadense]MSS83310.1 pilus assembly protein TadE [Scrofimicrobium canadense]